MAGQSGQIVLVVWRESVEALLVVGILNTWLAHHAENAASAGRRFLWAGVALGLLLAGLFGAALLWSAEFMDGDAEDYFQLTMVFVAAALILQMVWWMRTPNRNLKSALERGAQNAADDANWWGLLLLATLAVGREGSETAIFVYGIVASKADVGMLEEIAAVGGGFAAALLSYGVLQVSAKCFPWPLFFRVTEAMLLILAASLLMTGIDRAIGLELVSPLSAPLWDSSWLLDDRTALGSVVADLTGYRAHPELLPAIAYGLYWLTISALFPPRIPKKLPAVS